MRREGTLSAVASIWPQVPHISPTWQETFTLHLGAMLTIVLWGCFMIYLYFNPDEMDFVLPT